MSRQQQTISTAFDFQQAGLQVLAIESQALSQLTQYINDDFVDACQRLITCQGKVVVLGIGKSGHIARKIAATLASTGTPAFFVHPGEASHGDLGMIARQDMVLAISHSGESAEILALVPLLKRQQIPLIGMTGHPQSALAKAADIHLCVHVAQEACPLGLAPTSSTTATLVMGDALAIALLQAKGFTREDFALSHPGGALGRKLLLRVADIMHSDHLPMVRPTNTISETVLVMTEKNLGMVAICDDQQQILGIFTDGDLKRIFSQSIDIHQTPIAQVMTRGGLRISAEQLAVDALNKMQEKHITVLMVAKGDQLIGILHMHDLLRAGVV